ncbi:MAG: right-handed parallel beta-helix repeat-containing protein [Gammaproteobacteria bacterium]|nr:right-handed parallel beta-helix repeat-containing protein [Gammaproteobacteria bacterium]
MKNLVTILLSTFLQMIAQAAFANPVLSVDSASDFEGSVVSVSVNYSHGGIPNPPVSIKYTLSFNPTLLESSAPIAGTSLGGNHVQFSKVNNVAGTLDVIVVPAAGKVALSDGQILQIPFRLKNAGLNATVNQAVSPLTLSAVEMSNEESVTVGTLNNGIVTTSWQGPQVVTIPDGTPLSGQISEDSNLVPGGTYPVTADLTVNPGKTFSIAPGVTLQFASGTRLVVDGTLKVYGEAASMVTFGSDVVTSNRQYWQGLVFGPTSTGSVIDHADIQWAKIGVDVSAASVTISNSHISNFQTTGIQMLNGAGGLITNNVITGPGAQYSGTQGLYLMDAAVDVAGYDLTISGNTISALYFGIYVRKHSTPLINGDNEITGNRYGVYLMGNYTAAGNPQPVITGNRIYANTDYELFGSGYLTGASVTIGATGNWWGTMDIVTITDNIYDNVDNYYNSPVVSFVPMLDGASGNPTSGSALEGPIAGNQVLTTGNVYDILEEVVVEAGSSLTIPEGATLRFHGANAKLLVDGTLDVAGTVTNPVVFTSAKPTPYKGDWQGIVFGPSSSGSVIDYADIQWAKIGVDVSAANVTISNSDIRNFQTAGIHLRDGAGGLIVNNVINGFGTYNASSISMIDAAIDVVGYDLTISGNRIINSRYGINVGKHSNPVINGGNEITANQHGVFVDGNFTAAGNPLPVITGNSIYDNTQYNLSSWRYLTGASVTIDATGNWWGSVDIPTIASEIYDNVDNFDNAPVVTFLPMLDGAGGNFTSGSALEGPIAGNQVLTTGNVYDILEEVVVEAGSSLTIPEGATLRFHGANAKLLVDGTLDVAGTVTNPVVFTSAKPTPYKGDWQGIVFGPSSSGSVIDYADIQWAKIGVDVSAANVTISNSDIRNFQTAGIHLRDGAGGLIVNNVINGFGTYNASSISMIDAAIDVVGYDLTISGNRIINSRYGINVGKHSNPVINGGNEITANQHGVFVDGNFTAAGNPLPVITGNSIYDNTQYNLSSWRYLTGASVTIDATGNWWGSVDIPTIASEIYDNVDNFDNAPVVIYVPVLEIIPY